MAKRELGPSGVPLPGERHRLPEDTIGQVRTCLESKGFADRNLDPFLEELNNAFSFYFSCREIDQASRPPKVRKNLQSAKKAARKWLQELEQLDGSSKILLDEARPDNFHDLYRNAINAVNAVEAALVEAKRLPATRPKINYPIHQLALFVRYAIERHLGLKATSTKQSRKGAIFNDVLSIMVGAVEQASSNDISVANEERDVHKLTRRALKGEIRMYEGGAPEFIPALPSDIRNE